MTEGQGRRSTIFWLAEQATRINILIRRTRGRTEILPISINSLNCY
uniref:Uncharacterized protein n=1 Tax=Banana bunchy top virus TaxID=12585 RepID=W8VUI0_BBTV|nr:hypothetical protein [Banana bunchy top virus]BAO52871.1 hypothetical protein [Banana bunchy top virus]BAO52872.1 hypothetical protein [Banana bunchy top virus]BAO52873.1 hypothetical protein [Banana bunchy top virus]BAO52875.1 hypothetical protein [Banana bunchy top virus]